MHDGRLSKSSHFSNSWCFLKRFFAQNNSNVIKDRFSHVFLILIFDPNWLFCKGYKLCTMADFQTRLISRIFGIFSSGFLHRTIPIWLKNRFSHVFFLILIFDPNWLFCKGYSLCMMADFQNRLIFPIFGVFYIGFLHRTTLILLKNRFSHGFLYCNFWPKLTIFRSLSGFCYFPKAIAFAWWAIFKIVSFLEYLVFSQAVFCTEQL